MVKAPDYYIVCDIDDKMLKLNTDTFLTCWDYDFDWSMMGANQERQYYDLLALRTYDDWCDHDCWDNPNNKLTAFCMSTFAPSVNSIFAISVFPFLID
jgi:hypothetical protein